MRQNRDGAGTFRLTDPFFMLSAILLLTACAVAALVVTATIWIRRTLPASQRGRSGLESTTLAQVTRSEWLVFEPRAVAPETGIVFYPGGKAEPDAYAHVLRSLAEQGLLVVLVPMPLNLALLGREKAGPVLARFPQIRRWIIAGHSLGGAIACQFAARHPDQVAGLLLWAAFPGVETSLSDSRLPILSIVADGDTLTTAAKLAQADPRLPAHARRVSVHGADHWTFGDFAGLSTVADVVHRTLQQEVIAASLRFVVEIDSVNRPASPPRVH
jgi:uncharacterized membrane protein